MRIFTLNAQPLGNLVNDGKHKPFHALACPLPPRSKQIQAHPHKQHWLEL